MGFDFAQDGHEIFSGRIAPNGGVQDTPFGFPALGECNQPQFREFQLVPDNRDIYVRMLGRVRLHRILFALVVGVAVLFLEEAVVAVR